MKKIILAIGLMFGGAVFVNAQDQQQDTTQTQTQTQQSDQYRSDSTSTQNEQSDMYRTEGEGNTNDSTSVSGDQSTMGSDSSVGTQSTTGSTSTSESTSTSGGATTTDDQASSGSASSSSTSGTLSEDDQDQEGEKIEIAELPAAVSTKLQSTDYQGWVVTSARKKMWTDPNDTQATSKEVYVIEAKNGSETKKLKFDKDGNEIEHDKDKKDDQK